MASEDAGRVQRQVYSDLVAGLVDAREDPATARFDLEVDRALAAGGLSAEAAHRLRYWQRASVRSLADHVRVVLPTALGALEASRSEAIAAVEALADTLGPAATPEPADSLEADPPGAAGPGPATLGHRRNRLIVAELVSTAPDARADQG